MEIVFETTRRDESRSASFVKDRGRARKFSKILDEGGLGWAAKYTLIELFPKLEGYFDGEHSRKNFINLSQTAYYLCIMTGYPEEADKFKQLRTGNRREMIRSYLEKALGKMTVLNRISDIKLIRLGDDRPIECPKARSHAVPNHIYHDLNIKGDATHKNKKTKIKLLRKLQEGKG